MRRPNPEELTQQTGQVRNSPKGMDIDCFLLVWVMMVWEILEQMRIAEKSRQDERALVQSA